MQEGLATSCALFERPEHDLVSCWRLLWKAMGPEELPGALFYEGDAGQNRLGICIQAEDPALIELFAERLRQAASAILDGDACRHLTLSHAGRIDLHGRLVGDAKHARPALAEVRVIHERVAEIEPATLKRPKSERTASLPPILGFAQLKEFLKARFGAPPEANAPREMWLSPAELCDICEEFAWFLMVKVSEQVAPHSESVLHIRLFDKDRHELEPVHLAGLFAFSSRTDVTAFLASYSSNPAFSDLLPDMAGLAGRYQVNFGRFYESGRKLSFEHETAVEAKRLWGLFSARQLAFGEELAKAMEQVRRSKEAAARLAEQQRLEEEARLLAEQQAASEAASEREQRLKEEKDRAASEAEAQRLAHENELATMGARRLSGQCVFCGKGLGIAEKLKKLDHHKDCWRFSD